MHIELHHDFSPRHRYPVDIDQLFADAVEFRIGRVTARGLRPEHLLLHLVIHIVKSYFIVEHKHFLDIALLTKAVTLNWREVVSLLRASDV